MINNDDEEAVACELLNLSFFEILINPRISKFEIIIRRPKKFSRDFFDKMENMKLTDYIAQHPPKSYNQGRSDAFAKENKANVTTGGTTGGGAGKYNR